MIMIYGKFYFMDGLSGPSCMHKTFGFGHDVVVLPTCEQVHCSNDASEKRMVNGA